MCNNVQLCATSRNPQTVAITHLCKCATCATVFLSLRAQDTYNFNTLKRKTTSTVKVAGSKTISVEVRKKKTFVTPDPAEVAAAQKREQNEKRAAEDAARKKAEAESRQRDAEEAGTNS